MTDAAMSDTGMSGGLEDGPVNRTSEEQSHRGQSDNDDISHKGEPSCGPERGTSFRGRRRAPRRFGGWRGSSQTARGTHNRTVEKAAAVSDVQKEIGGYGHGTLHLKVTSKEEANGQANSPSQIDLSELVCEPDSSGVRIVQEKENSLIIQVNCVSSGDTRGRERGGTGRGFYGRGFRSQRRGRGRIAVDARHYVDDGVGVNSSSDLNTNTHRIQFEDEREQSRRGGTRSRGRWYDSGWRRGGAGRYFRQRPAARLDSGSDEKNFVAPNYDISSLPKTSDTSNAASSSPRSADTYREQNTKAADAEDFSANTESNKNARGVHSANRRRPYVVRRSSSGRCNDAFFANTNEEKITMPQNLCKTEDKSSTVPCSSPDAEDWDAECFPVETTYETETDAMENPSTLNCDN